MKRTLSWNLRYLLSWTARILCILPHDATPLQRTKDAGPDNDYNTDDGWDIVYYFDYTVDSQDDDNAAADDYDFQAGFLTDSQQVKILTLTHAYGTVFFCLFSYCINVPYRVNFYIKKINTILLQILRSGTVSKKFKCLVFYWY